MACCHDELNLRSKCSRSEQVGVILSYYFSLLSSRIGLILSQFSLSTESVSPSYRASIENQIILRYASLLRSHFSALSAYYRKVWEPNHFQLFRPCCRASTVSFVHSQLLASCWSHSQLHDPTTVWEPTSFSSYIRPFCQASIMLNSFILSHTSLPAEVALSYAKPTTVWEHLAIEAPTKPSSTFVSILRVL